MNELKIALRKRMDNREDLENISIELINKMMNDFDIPGKMAKEILFEIYKTF